MTDGIIQQVFTKYHKAYFRVNYSNIDYESLMRAIEQELIEKIKQFSQEDHIWINYEEMIRIKDLIGED